MQKKWIIVDKNINTGNFVAVMMRKHKNEKDNSDIILTISEGKSGYLVCFSREYSFFDDYYIPYDKILPAIDELYPDAAPKERSRYAIIQAMLQVQNDFEDAINI